MSAKPTVMVLGGGYAGLFAIRRLAACRHSLDVVLVDRKPFSENLPMLPDVVGRRVQPDSLRYDLQQAARRRGARFVRASVADIDLESRTAVCMNGRRIQADYLLICTGTETDFHGREDLASASRRLDTVADAVTISRLADDADFDNVVVVGAGYTGVELITNIHRRLTLRRTMAGKTLHLADVADTILPGLDQHVRAYCARNMEALGIRMHTGTGVVSAADRTVELDSGATLPNCLLLWTAGVRTPACVRTLAGDKPRGRLAVDPTLRVADRVYAAGDAAGFGRRGALLRPAVQFAITEGRAAAGNIVREIDGAEPRACQPRDFGYVVPMANFRGCGQALGVRVNGRIAALLHYGMCLYRSFGIRNRIGVLCDLLAAGNMPRGPQS